MRVLAPKKTTPPTHEMKKIKGLIGAPGFHFPRYFNVVDNVVVLREEDENQHQLSKYHF